ncbi:MAG: dynamin family protein [Sedimenticola sp.]|uniref:Dynamin family protein n=1 Tax=Sedimenticola thiotaurini TaxID=1543721 RepID=A0A558D6J9_9GAMM|nr:dynamin family protein [Sedimenticola sp.]TVT56635.1 MAG: dynamin family protein [Sedimenticola thiotaurini]MCW8948011.1 dynamin family protein [Sedimenticola sp.]MCW8950920.1 dynamin family protein [Sedimenticola sp.]MCW8974745.1 dynamin family protein [Sedimenticola sp.]
MNTAGRLIEGRLKHLETHLEQENPVLLKTVQSFKKLDRIAYRTGLLDTDESYATQIPWWPLISVLGTFSSGKSTFINHYLGYKLQRTGNQAVDDKFTVTCYSREKTAHALPGVALDSDPRFPFYQMSEDIELVAQGEGQRIDSYLQLKTCPSEQLRGKILIDSPGFDADAQRTSTLKITDHIIDLSDLVLVFFDARHPEPGAMHDTLDHLVSNTINRTDAGKFLYILNQIDSAAREDNPEEVVAAWQRALGERGLTAGRFYTIYNPDAAVPIADDNLRQRFERKRDADLEEIHNRMHEVEIERAYRIVGVLERTARDIEERAIPAISEAVSRWKKRVLWGDAIAYSLLLIGMFGISIKQGYWEGLHFSPPWLESLLNSPTAQISTGIGIVLVIVGIHFFIRSLSARSLLRKLRKQSDKLAIRGSLANAFLRNTKPWRSVFSKSPAGWGRGAKKRLAQVKEDADNYVQSLNDRFTNPSGEETFSLSEMSHHAPNAPTSVADADKELDSASTSQA